MSGFLVSSGPSYSAYLDLRMPGLQAVTDLHAAWMGLTGLVDVKLTVLPGGAIAWFEPSCQITQKDAHCAISSLVHTFWLNKMMVESAWYPDSMGRMPTITVLIPYGARQIIDPASLKNALPEGKGVVERCFVSWGEFCQNTYLYRVCEAVRVRSLRAGYDHHMLPLGLGLVHALHGRLYIEHGTTFECWTDDAAKAM